MQMAPDTLIQNLLSNREIDLPLDKQCYVAGRDSRDTPSFSRKVKLKGDLLPQVSPFWTYRSPGQGMSIDDIYSNLCRSHKLIPVIEIKNIIEDARQLEKKGDSDQSLDLIYDHFDKLFWSASWTVADDILRDVKVSKYSLDILLAILTSTLPAADKLPSRKTIFNNIENELRSRDELDNTLLVGLEG